MLSRFWCKKAVFLVSLHFVPGLQSAVCSLHFVLAGIKFAKPAISHFTHCNASVNSSTAQPPPWANHQALTFFFFKMGKFPGVGTHRLSKMPQGGDEERRQIPAPRIIAFQHFCRTFFIYPWIQCSVFQCFNVMVLKTSRTTARVSWLYWFLYILFLTNFLSIFFCKHENKCEL